MTQWFKVDDSKKVLHIREITRSKGGGYRLIKETESLKETSQVRDLKRRQKETYHVII